MTIYAGLVEGDLTLFKGDDASEVTRIEGNLDLNEGAICASPQLTNIGGFLDISDGAVCNLPRLTSVGGYPVPGPDPAVSSDSDCVSDGSPNQ